MLGGNIFGAQMPGSGSPDRARVFQLLRTLNRQIVRLFSISPLDRVSGPCRCPLPEREERRTLPHQPTAPTDVTGPSHDAGSLLSSDLYMAPFRSIHRCRSPASDGGCP